MAIIKFKSKFNFFKSLLAFIVLSLFSSISYAAYVPLEIIQPRAGLDTTNRFYKAYPGLEYNVRLAVAGGAYPFQFSLSQAPAGSQLAFTYVRKDFIEGKNLYGLEKLYKQTIVKNKLWLFGFEPEEVDNFLSEYGWRLVEHLGYDELAERYMKPTGRELLSLMIERMVYATKM